MAYCTEYENMDDEEKVLFIAKLIHAIQKENWACKAAQHLIMNAEEFGVFKNVKFGRDALLNEKPVQVNDTNNKE